MKQIRIGNDIKVTLTVTRHHHPEPLAHKDIVVMLRNKRTAVEITDFHVEDGNKVTFVWRGEEQTVTGPYYATLYIRKGQHQNVEDTGYIFTLVPTSHDIKDCDRHHHHGGVCEDGGKIDVGVSVGAWCDWHEHADYRKLHHRPAINGVELVGNLSLHALGIQPEGDYVERDELKTVTDGIKARFEGIDAGIDGMRKELNDLNHDIEQALNSIDTGILPFDYFVANRDEVKEYPDGTICFVPGIGGGFFKADSSYEPGYIGVYVVFEGVERHLVTRTDVVYRCGEVLYRLERYLEDGVLAPSYSYRLRQYLVEGQNGDYWELEKRLEELDERLNKVEGTPTDAKINVGIYPFRAIENNATWIGNKLATFAAGDYVFDRGNGTFYFIADPSDRESGYYPASDYPYTTYNPETTGNTYHPAGDVVFRCGSQLYVSAYDDSGKCYLRAYMLGTESPELLDALEQVEQELDAEDMAEVLGEWGHE